MPRLKSPGYARTEEGFSDLASPFLKMASCVATDAPFLLSERRGLRGSERIRHSPELSPRWETESHFVAHGC